MCRKTAFIILALFTLSAWAYDVYGLWELDSGDVTLNEDLHVHPGGSVQPYNGHRILTVNGNIINEGTIQNHTIGYLLTVNCSGNITNNGVLTNYTTNLTGSVEQRLSVGSSSTPISSQYINVNNANPILALTNLYFKDSYIDFVSGGFDLRGGYGVKLDNCYMTDGNVTGKTGITPVSYLEMINDSRINNSTCSDLYLIGYFQLENDVIISGTSINIGDVMPAVNGHRILTINGIFFNNGTFKNNAPYLLHVNSNGVFTNNGILNHYVFNAYSDFWCEGNIYNDYLYFLGTSAQYLSCSATNGINAFYVSSTNSAGIIAQSDLKFTNSYLNFSDYALDLTGGYDLALSGGYLNRVKIFGDTSGKAVSYLNMTNGCYMQNTELNQLTLTGEIEIVDNANVFNGPIVNNGIVENHSWYWYTINVNGDFINNSIVRDNPLGYNLTFNIKGNLINNGTWDNEYLYFNGTSSQQNLTCLNGNLLESYYLNCSNPNGVKLLSDVVLRNSWVNFTDYTLDLTAGYDLTLNGGYLNRINILGSEAKSTSSLSMKNGCYMQNTVIDKVDLRDTILVVDNANILKGPLTNYGLIQNHPWYWYTLNIEGDFSNEGLITDNAGGYNLSLNVKGNVQNNGIWTNNRTDFNGDSHQHISILNGNAIASPETYFTTNIVNGPYEWRYNKTPIAESDPDFSGETIQSLRWLVPVTLAYTGTFYCETGDGASKCVYINNGTFEIPNITSFTNNGTNVSISWNAIPSAAYYRVFSSDDPYKDHYDSSWFCEDEYVTTNSWTATVPAGNKIFYFVTAVY
jgi:hypothetical protein